MASHETSVGQYEDEDRVHALRRRRDQREQGSRTGRCGWITSFLGIRVRILRDLEPIPGRSSESENSDETLPTEVVLSTNARRISTHDRCIRSGSETKPCSCHSSPVNDLLRLPRMG